MGRRVVGGSLLLLLLGCAAGSTPTVPPEAASAALPPEEPASLAPRPDSTTPDRLEGSSDPPPPGDGTAATDIDRYLQAMHRPLHDRWTRGFLEMLDRQPADHPLNDQVLWTRGELHIDIEGRVKSIVTVRSSGLAAFDETAVEIIEASGPFPRPPDALISPDGTTYMHWTFHRDQRACTRAGAQPFIIDPQARL